MSKGKRYTQEFKIEAVKQTNERSYSYVVTVAAMQPYSSYYYLDLLRERSSMRVAFLQLGIKGVRAVLNDLE